MPLIPDTAPEYEPWRITDIGGTADWVEELTPFTPQENSRMTAGATLPLAMATAGDRVWVVHIQGGHRMVRRLTDLGIVQGSEITVVSRTGSGSVIVALQGCRIGVGAGMAHRVMVTTTELAPLPSDAPQTPAALSLGEHDMSTPTLNLGGLEVGHSGRIMGYASGSRAYRSKLLSMGLTPGTHFTITRQAPLGDPVEIEVRGYKLSLRKGEAAALLVEPVTG
jgi:ferrous iron transport protein A